ncbi:hypothetical protein ACFL0Z_00140 [Patescibacteria group bacterium]
MSNVATPSIMKGMKVVLNGDDEVMTDATIPVAWYFDENVIAERPELVGIVVQTDYARNHFESHLRGKRYICKVEIGFKYIQLSSSGRHTITVFAIKPDEVKSPRAIARALLEKENCGEYEISVGENYLHKKTLSYCVMEIEIPDELFASKPKKGWRKFVWNMTNGPFSQAPRDECQYGQRLFVFPIFLFIWAFYRLLKYFVIGPFRGLYALIGCPLVFLAGWRPVPVFAKVWTNITWQPQDSSWYNLLRNGRYRLWRLWEDSSYVRHKKMMPITAAEILLLVLIPIGIFYLLKFGFPKVDIVLEVCLSILLTLNYGVLLISLANRFGIISVKKAATNRQERKEIRTGSRITAKLKRFYAADQAPAQISFRELTQTGLRQKSPVMVFRAAYWGIKTKICRPFSC